MSHIKQQVFVHCPLAQAASRIRDFFRAHGNAEGDTAHIILQLPLKQSKAMSNLLERDVIMTIQPKARPGDMTPRYAIQWGPEMPGPFPLFAGELYVESADDYNAFSIRLKGSYKPPLGLFGKGFDVVLGNNIAGAVTDDLLERMRDEIEHAYLHDEANKRVPTVVYAPVEHG